MTPRVPGLPSTLSSLSLFLLLAMAQPIPDAHAAANGAPQTIEFTLRSAQPGQPAVTTEKTARWDPRKTAIIVCDMWDDHWCRSAARRVGELAGPMNQLLRAARTQGIFIIHSPSSVTAFYKDTPQRKRAQHAPFAATPAPLSTSERWGTMWCWPDPTREKDLPIDDADMGCSCTPVKCKIREAWTRQISTLQIAPGDALTDNGQETWNLLTEHGIDHVILMGVHLNMCVLGRPFGIRQLVRLGKEVVLMRDLTDTMYDPKKRPWVSHFEGTDLVIDHVEKYWCPTVTSSAITGKKPFRFKDDTRRESPTANRTAF